MRKKFFSCMTLPTIPSYVSFQVTILDAITCQQLMRLKLFYLNKTFSKAILATSSFIFDLSIIILQTTIRTIFDWNASAKDMQPTRLYIMFFSFLMERQDGIMNSKCPEIEDELHYSFDTLPKTKANEIQKVWDAEFTQAFIVAKACLSHPINTIS